MQNPNPSKGGFFRENCTVKFTLVNLFLNHISSEVTELMIVQKISFGLLTIHSFCYLKLVSLLFLEKENLASAHLVMYHR